VHVAQAVGALQLLDALSRLVEVAPELTRLVPTRAGGILIGVVADRDDNRARHPSVAGGAIDCL
jgi:hypothetical protein